jgi:hypothetical protein
MSTQFGSIAGDAGPTLLRILTQLNPLFVTFGDLVGRGAGELEGWAKSSDGVSAFVAYVQAELPDVMQFLGQLVVLFGHLAQGAAPFGGVILTDITLLVRALNALPIGTLQVLIPLVVSLRVAMLAYRGVSAVIDGVTKAYARMAPQIAASNAAAEAASAQMRARAAEDAAVFAESEATKARAAAQTALQIAESVEATGSVLEQGAFDAAVAADQFAAAMEEEALAARRMATQVATSAEEAATAASTASATASVGWAGALGPVAALGAGVALLSTVFLHNGASAQEAARATDDYTQALIQSKGAIDDSVRSAVAKQLADQGLLDAATKLHINLATLTDAVLGNGDAMATVQGRIDDVTGSLKTQAQAAQGAGGGLTGAAQDVFDAANKLSKGVGQQSDAFKQARTNASEQAAAVRSSAQAQREATAAARDGAAAFGVTADAYTKAKQAADKNAESTRQQTLAFRLASDAASLLDQRLQALAGHGLSMAEAQTALHSANLAVLQSFKENGKVVDGASAKAVANQEALQQQANAAIQVAEQVGKATKSTDDEVASLQRSKKALEEQLAAHHKLTPAVKEYLDRLYDIKNLKLPPTKVDLDKKAADKKIADLEADIRAIKQGKLPDLDANSAPGRATIKFLQGEIDDLRQGRVPDLSVNPSPALLGIASVRTALDGLHDKQVTITTFNLVGGNRHAGPTASTHAAGGTIHGPGTGTSDSVLARLSNGEEVTKADQAEKHRRLLKAINAGASPTVLAALALQGYAQGGTVGNYEVYPVGSGFGFQGQFFAKRKDAESARRDALRASQSQHIFDQGQTTDVTKREGGASAVAQMIRGEIPGAKAAMRDLAKAVDDAFKLSKAKDQLAGLRQTLADMKSFRSDVDNTIAGGFDPTQFGSIASLIGGLGSATSGNRGELAEIKKLQREHLNAGFLTQLIQNGNTGLLDVLAAGNKGDIGQVNKALGGFNASVAGIGNAAVVSKFGKSVDQQQRQIDRLVAEIQRDRENVKRLAAAVSSFTHKPTVVELDGDVIARASGQQHARNLHHHAGRHG